MFKLIKIKKNFKIHIYCIIALLLGSSADYIDLYIMNHEAGKCLNMRYMVAAKILLKIPQKFLTDSLPSDNCELPDNARASHISEIPETRRDSRCCADILAA